MSEVEKKTLLDSESVLIPVIIDQDGAITVTDGEAALSTEEKKQVFLVHLQVGKMAVTVYTSKDYAEENVEYPEAETAIPDDTNSDELNDSGDEFSVP